METTCKVDYDVLNLFKQLQTHWRERGVKAPLKEIIAAVAAFSVSYEDKIFEKFAKKQEQDPLEKFLAYAASRRPRNGKKFSSVKEHDLVF